MPIVGLSQRWPSTTSRFFFACLPLVMPKLLLLIVLRPTTTTTAATERICVQIQWTAAFLPCSTVSCCLATVCRTWARASARALVCLMCIAYHTIYEIVHNNVWWWQWTDRETCAYFCPFEHRYRSTIAVLQTQEMSASACASSIEMRFKFLPFFASVDENARTLHCFSWKQLYCLWFWSEWNSNEMKWDKISVAASSTHLDDF